MIDTKKMHFRQEGEAAFPVEEKDTSSDSSTEETTQEDDKAGDEKKPDTPLPFNEDPKVQDFIERQVAKRVEGIEQKLTEKFGGDVTKIREEFGEKRKQNAEQTVIPKWFGGTQEQWNDYRSWFDGELKTAEDRAVNSTIERAKETTSAEQKRIDEATEHFKGELAAITADKKLNPSGKAVDPNALLKAAMDNDLVDSKGRWNYRAALRFLPAQKKPVENKSEKEKRELAAATMDGAGGKGGEQSQKSFKTAADFKKKRPW